MHKAEGPVLRNSHYVTIRSEGQDLMATARAYQGFVQLMRNELGPHAVAAPQEWMGITRVTEPGSPDRYSLEATIVAQVAVQPFTLHRKETATDARLAGVQAADVRTWSTDVLETVTATIMEGLRAHGLASDAATFVTAVSDAPRSLMKRAEPERVWARRLRLTAEHSREEPFEVRWSQEPEQPQRPATPGQQQPNPPAKRRIGFRPQEDLARPSGLHTIPAPRTATGQKSALPASVRAKQRAPHAGTGPGRLRSA